MNHADGYLALAEESLERMRFGPIYCVSVCGHITLIPGEARA